MLVERGLVNQVVGKDLARARLESRNGLLSKGGTPRVSRPARIQSDRVRLHDVHRKLGTAAERRRRCGRRRRSHRRRGALRQSQLRRAHPSAGSRELSRFAAAGRSLRAGRPHRRGPDHRAARHGSDGKPVFLREIWPSNDAIATTMAQCISEEMFRREYADVFKGDENWSGLNVAASERYSWDPESEYVKRPPYFDGMPARPAPLRDVHGARAIAVFGDSVTTDHISPAGSIAKKQPGGKILVRTRHRAARFQFVRRAARQPRSDGARHICERAAAQRARAGRRGWRYALPARATSSSRSSMRHAGTLPMERR